MKLFVCLLTRSSSAVRLGVRMGACGTLGSLPRLGGKGSRGTPLDISFKEDILLSIFWPGGRLTLTANGPLRRERLWTSLFTITLRLIVSLAFWSSLPFTIHQWYGADRKGCLVIIDPWGSLKWHMLQWTNSAEDLWPLMLRHVTSVTQKWMPEPLDRSTTIM